MKRPIFILVIIISFLSCNSDEINSPLKLFQTLKKNRSNESVLNSLVYNLNSKWHPQNEIIKGIKCGGNDSCKAILFCSDIALDSLSVQNFIPVDSLSKFPKRIANLFLDSNLRLFDVIPSKELYYYSKHPITILLQKKENQYKLVHWKNLELFDETQYPNYRDLDVFQEFWKLKAKISEIHIQTSDTTSVKKEINRQIETITKQIYYISSICLEKANLPKEMFYETKYSWDCFYPNARKALISNNHLNLIWINNNQLSILKTKIEKLNKLTQSKFPILNTSDICTSEGVCYSWEGWNFEINNLIQFLIELKRLEVEINQVEKLAN